MEEVWWTGHVSDPRLSGMPDQRDTESQLADLRDALELLSFPEDVLETLDLPRRGEGSEAWVGRYVGARPAPPPERDESQLVIDAYAIASRLAMYDAADSIRFRNPCVFDSPKP